MERSGAIEGRSTQPRPRGSGRGLYGLLVVNAILLGLLGVVTFSPAADVQDRIRGDYAMVAGGVKGSLSDVVYVVDTVNQELIALSWEPSTKELQGIGYRSLMADAESLTSTIRPR